jgi:glycosyltransferase involved in cell wall biosynthesis
VNVIFLRSNPVDPDSRVEKEVNALLKVGHSVKVLAWDRDSKYSLQTKTLNLENGEVEIFRIGIPATFGGGFKRNLLPLIMFQLNIYHWLKKNISSFDVIHACDFDTSFTSIIFAKLHNKKIVYDIFDYYVDSFKIPIMIKPFIEFFDSRIIKYSDAVILCSEERIRQVKNPGRRRFHIIHNSPPEINSNQTNSNYQKSNKLKIVYVGILDEGRMIKEIVKIVQSCEFFELHIAGFGRLEDYLINVARACNNIFFYGRIPYGKTLELERMCDIITAIYDPKIRNHKFAAPNKFYEALMLGKPLIMISGTGKADFVNKEQIGFVIDYEYSSLKQAFTEIYENIDYWRKSEDRIKKYYTDFSWSEMEKRLIAIYNQFVD